jgi:hypothetical protein
VQNFQKFIVAEARMLTSGVMDRPQYSTLEQLIERSQDLIRKAEELKQEQEKLLRDPAALKERTDDRLTK